MAHPWSLVGWGALAYGLFSGALAIPALWHGPEVGLVIAWAFLALMLAFPVAVFVGLGAAGREWDVTGKAGVGRFLWLGNAVGAVGMSHFAWMLPVSIIGLVRAVGSSGWEREMGLQLALYGLIPWGGFALAGIILGGTLYGFRKRGYEPAIPLPRPPTVFNAFALSSAVYFPAMAGMCAFVDEGGDGRSMALPSLVLALGLGAAANAVLAASIASGRVMRARFTAGVRPWVGEFVRAFGAATGTQWGWVFVFTLLGTWHGAVGQRFVLQLAAAVLLSASAGAVGWGMSMTRGDVAGAVRG